MNTHMDRSTVLRVKNLIFLILPFYLGPFHVGPAWSHAVVTESSLAHEPIRPHHATTVVLFFNSNVELALSRVFLVSKGDVYHPAQIDKGKKPGEVRIQLPALDPGDYALKYKVFAADGHFTESVIRFNVSEQR
jgi:methionine-rich copper-binding protein CopC